MPFLLHIVIIQQKKRKSRARADGKTVADRLKQWKDHNEGENQQRRKVHAKGSKKRLYEGWDEQR